jgi:hypothetical protein
MKRAVFLYSLLFMCLSAGAVAFGQSDAKPEARSDAGKDCPFNITGLWRSDATTQTNPIFFSFSPQGHVMLMSHSGDALPQDFEVITSVSYKLDKPAAPRRIEFTAWRGNDVFLQGVTSWKITEYGDDSFTTVDPATERPTRWTRERTHRYFLTFAARSGPLPHGGPALAMWTLMDGRQTRIDALGVRLTRGEADRTVPVFGPVPAEVYEQITEESDKEKKKEKEENLIVRFELTEAEFKKTHEIYQAWDKRVKTQKLPHDDPYLNAMEFLSSTMESLDPCGEKVKLNRPTRLERDEITAKIKPPQQSLEYIRVMRKKNGELHISDVAFPWQWRPTIQLPGQ